MRNFPSAVAAIFALAATACTPSDKAPAGGTPAESTAAATATPAEPAVRIASPADGDSVSLPFTVTLEAMGVELVAANGTRESGKGHHHLIIDGDTPSDSLPLAAAPVVIHMGDASTSRKLDSLAAGPHRIIAVFASGDHVPMTTVKRDTITVIVR